MAKKLTNTERQQIIDLLHTGQPARAIADQVGRSTDTVSRIARTIGHRFGQQSAARAREAKSAYSAERRAVAASKAQERLEELLDGFTEPRQVAVNTPAGVQLVEQAPDWRAIRDLASAINTLQRTVLDIDRHDNKADEGLAAVDQWLRGMIG